MRLEGRWSSDSTCWLLSRDCALRTLCSFGDLDRAALAQRPDDAFHERPGVAHRIVELAHDAVDADRLQRGNAVADFLERADQPEFEAGVGIHHLLFAERSP